MRSAEAGAAAPAARPPWPGFLDRFAPAYEAEMDAFLRVVARRARPIPATGREALRALLIAEACEVSRRERRPVHGRRGRAAAARAWPGAGGGRREPGRGE